MKLATGATVAILIVSSAALAYAETSGSRQAQRSWKRGDECNKKAFELFPDYTREQISKRDAYVRACQADLKEPGRQPLAPQGDARR
jgi:hypothetical protein